MEPFRTNRWGWGALWRGVVPRRQNHRVRSRTPLPPRLRGRAILTSEGSEEGVGRGRLRGTDVAHPFHGISAVEMDLSTVIGRCSAYEPRLRDGQWFSHITALELFGAPLPVSSSDELHIAVVWPRTPPRPAGVTGHVVRSGVVSTDVRHGFPVISAPGAWVQSAADLRREDLVAAGDFLVTGRKVGLHREAPIARLADLAEAAGRARGAPGAPNTAWALQRIRVGPDSRPESLLRLLIVRARLPEPVIGHPVPIAGGLTLHPDLAFVAARIALEYEGDGHRVDRATWLADLERYELLAAEGWRVIRVTSADVFERPREFIVRLRRALAQAR